MIPTALRITFRPIKARAPFAFASCDVFNWRPTVWGDACVNQPVQRECTRYVSRKMHNRRESISPTIRERIGELRRNGTPEIVFGSFILALAGIDYILRGRNDKEREAMVKQLEREVRRDAESTRKEDLDMLNEGLTAKFECIIRKVPENFDGHKCLKSVKVGDIVGVIEDEVGPGGQYHLCFKERGTPKAAASGSSKNVSIGWYPCSCLQKVEQ